MFGEGKGAGMTTQSMAFDKTYEAYLSHIAAVDFSRCAEKLGVQIEEDGVIIPFFGNLHFVSPSGIVDSTGMRPLHAISVVLFNYLLLCPETDPTEVDWVSYRDFKDAAPFAGAFANHAEKSIAMHFSGKLDALRAACESLSGQLPAFELSYDLSMVFNALPKVPILLLFNDKDEEFSATCSVLFEKRAEKYLDMECLAIVGWLLSDYLKRKDGAEGSALL